MPNIIISPRVTAYPSGLTCISRALGLRGAFVTGGSILAANVRLSSVALGAHFSCDTDLSAYVSTADKSYIITLYDTLNRALLAYTGAVGPGENATEKLVDPGFDAAGSWNIDTDWSVAGSTAIIASAGGAASNLLQNSSASILPGMLIKNVMVCSALTVAGSYKAFVRNWSLTTYNSIGTKTDYLTIPATGSGDFSGIQKVAGALSAVFDSLSQSQVTDPAATGFYLRDGPKLSGAQSVLSTDGLNPNVALTYRIWRVL